MPSSPLFAETRGPCEMCKVCATFCSTRLLSATAFTAGSMRVAFAGLADRVGQLPAADGALEALDELRIGVGPAREGRHLNRPVVDDRRLDQLRLDEVRVRVVDKLRPGLVVSRVDAGGVQLCP